MRAKRQFTVSIADCLKLGEQTNSSVFLKGDYLQLGEQRDSALFFKLTTGGETVHCF
jgi:hypothetical protein